MAVPTFFTVLILWATLWARVRAAVTACDDLGSRPVLRGLETIRSYIANEGAR